MERCWSGDKQSRGVVHQLGGGGGGEWLTGHKRPTEFRRVCLRNPNAYQTPTMNASSSTISNTHQQVQQSYLQIHPQHVDCCAGDAILSAVTVAKTSRGNATFRFVVMSINSRSIRSECPTVSVVSHYPSFCCDGLTVEINTSLESP